MTRKLIVLIGVFAVLAGVSIYLGLYGRPETPHTNPLKKSDLDKIDRISIDEMMGKVELEKTPKGWELTAPVHDAADPQAINEITDSLKEFELGSIVSENASKYPQFELDKRAAHIRVYLKGETKPVLDAHIGRNAGGYANSFFRFDASTPVFIADQLPEYKFRRSPNSFRQTKLLPVSVMDSTAIKIAQEKSTWDLVKSSNTWTVRANAKVLDQAIVKPVLSKLENLRAQDFTAGTEKPDQLGFNKPYFKVEVETPAGPASIEVGNKAPKAAPETPQLRFVKTDGRDAIMLLRDDVLTDLIASLKYLR